MFKNKTKPPKYKRHSKCPPHCSTMWLMGASHKCLLVTIETNEKRETRRAFQMSRPRASSSCQSQGEFALHSWLKRLHTHTRRSFTNVDREWMAVVRGAGIHLGVSLKANPLRSIGHPSLVPSEWKRSETGGHSSLGRSISFVYSIDAQSILFLSFSFYQFD